MKRKIFIEGTEYGAKAYIGWQDKELSLYGVKEGYKRSADSLVNIAIKEGSKHRIDILDLYIYPIMFSYRHSIEISLKLIYNRAFGELPKGGHDMIAIWDKYIVNGVLDKMQLLIDDKEIKEIRNLIKELQGEDSKGDVWRYLMNKEGSLYFTEWDFIDYANLKDTINYLYNFLDGVYNTIDDILSD
ncbi:hypothetical protein psyc5s11_53700 [Clostridium gelidum]|uniref:HEPN domain-containing protein n=1 Tax=Clostridium gelidum TaxID=704125 RepID=A0ABM7TD90_9CLOT|nr:hypothetical protein [Clostridium gelidum]BCZ49303.1 hypothetical protein psyc5s11_53700 [Clostridium gelidum]